MLSKNTKILTVIIAITSLFACSQVNAQLVYLGAEGFGGTGLGAVNTVLTIQKNGTESGSVGLNS
jgi:hypothetical protein